MTLLAKPPSKRKQLVCCTPSGRIMTRAEWWKIYWRTRRARERELREWFPDKADD